MIESQSINSKSIPTNSYFQFITFKQQTPIRIKNHCQRLIKSFGVQEWVKNLMGERQLLSKIMMQLNSKTFIQIFQFIQTINTQVFRGEFDYQSKIGLNRISHINLQRLIILDVRFCQIKTIQTLSFMNIPVVKQIKVQLNQIKNMKILQKLNLRKLVNISFGNNKMTWFTYLQRISRMGNNWLISIQLLCEMDATSQYNLGRNLVKVIGGIKQTPDKQNRYDFINWNNQSRMFKYYALTKRR